ncbi:MULTISPECIES: hypothetical protein [unclassified Rhizobium]|uniref:hypothetical protein n=1 Tax=unclassified Rhizobium TaxID=2613769 RepID=UPI0006F4F0FC|nr:MULTISPECIES: hypothetical protein [unclassified Rhizobium]KQV43597.1 hypothetical protein ASC86_01950 [Rhizobium sp. Root1212]KRD37781.1 hypothetical protein ASE37_01950 [Rhizobium sp. Root268]
MNEPLKKLIEAARKAPHSKNDIEVQRRSFAYGNTHFENSKITREMVDKIADKMPYSGDISHTKSSNND